MNKDPDIVTLQFSADPPAELLNNIQKNTRISFFALPTTYSYTLLQVSDNSKQITIDFNFGGEFSNGPVMFLEFILTPEIQLDDSFFLTQKIVNLTLPDYYLLSETLKNSMKTAGESTKRGSQFAQVMMVMQNMMNVGSSVAVKSLVLMELIRFLRFVDIK